MTNSKIPHRSTLGASPARAALAAVTCAGSVALVVFAFACGRTAEADPADGGQDGSTGSSSNGDAFAPSFDATITPRVDADTTPIDAGSPPVVACTDAGEMCASPPSDCLDDHTMRYFSGGTCNDAGTCDFTISTLHCDPSPMPPDCYQGGCRVVIVR
jgi:hypothetical protein